MDKLKNIAITYNLINHTSIEYDYEIRYCVQPIRYVGNINWKDLNIKKKDLELRDSATTTYKCKNPNGVREGYLINHYLCHRTLLKGALFL